ncbi:MAG TPA: ABC transporter ATP-binding protein [Clostridia bacterium]|nr:ABC transporter ATP-binding protein [Clostridia bacterium]
MIAIETTDLKVEYGSRVALQDVSIKIKEGEIVTIIGPNGSGKSTLVKAISRCLKFKSGNIEIYNKDIYSIPTKVLARNIAVLPQVKNISADITVENLVSYGRYPHLGLGKRLNKKDKMVIKRAMEQTGLFEFRDRYVTTLSGGERQRAWIAMALAQEPKILIMDEPTTYLDISYQLEVLELIKELNESLGLTVIMVLHDLNQAARYSDNIYVLKDGRVCDYGTSEYIMQSKLFKDVFKIYAHIYEDKENNCPYFIPYNIVQRR